MSVSGTWNIIVAAPTGDQKSKLTLEEDGSALKGTMEAADGNSAPITNGSVDTDKVGWHVAITTPFPMTLEFSGTVDGDAMTGKVKAGSFGSYTFSGTRA